MPVQYTTIVEEHEAVRKRVGLFDISHMGRLTFDGPGVLDWLERVTTNRVASLADNQIQYSLVANERGGVIDDILVYRQPFAYLVVCNASNRDSVVRPVQMPPLRRGGQLRRSDDGHGDDRRAGPAGPRNTSAAFRPAARQAFPTIISTMGRLLGSLNTVISRTGYTGEDGFELIVGDIGRCRRLGGALEIGQAPRRDRLRAGGPRHAAAGSRRCRFTATSSPTRSTRFRPAWPGRSSSTRASSSGARRSKASRNGRRKRGSGSRSKASGSPARAAVVFRERPRGRRGHLGNVFADPASQPGDGLRRARARRARHQAHRRRPGPSRAGPVVKLPFYKRARKATAADSTFTRRHSA